MAINAGGGGHRKPSRKPLPVEPIPRPKKPLQPIPGSPFPEDKGFRLGQFRVLEEKDDYLLCTGYDPNAKDPFSEVTPSAFRTGVLMKVAKPPALQRTPWDGKTVTFGDTEYTYDYSDDEFGVRTTTWTDNDNVGQEEEQRIDPPYTLDDDEVSNQIIVAVQIRKNAAVDGMESTDEDGARLRWVDLNVSGRRWKAPASSEILTRIVRLDEDLAAANSVTTGAQTATASVHAGDGNVGGEWMDTGDNITVVNRDTTNSYSSGDYGIALKILGEWLFSPLEC